MNYIRIDATNCIHIVQGYSRFENGMEDYWYYSNQIFESGKSYGLTEIIRFLTDNNRLVVLPVGSDEYIKDCVDKCVYITWKNCLEEKKPIQLSREWGMSEQ